MSVSPATCSPYELAQRSPNPPAPCLHSLGRSLHWPKPALAALVTSETGLIVAFRYHRSRSPSVIGAEPGWLPVALEVSVRLALFCVCARQNCAHKRPPKNAALRAGASRRACPMPLDSATHLPFRAVQQWKKHFRTARYGPESIFAANGMSRAVRKCFFHCCTALNGKCVAESSGMGQALRL